MGDDERDDVTSLAKANISVAVNYTRQENWQVLDMTAEASSAHKEIARYTHAVPAEELTKREREGSRRHYATGIVCLVLAGLACFKLDGGYLVTVLLALGGYVTATGTVSDLIRGRKDQPALPGEESVDLVTRP